MACNLDPIFYLHHGGVDRLWHKWQHANLKERLLQIEGRTSTSPPYGQITLDFRLNFGGVGGSTTVRNTMDTRMEPYCYTYDD